MLGMSFLKKKFKHGLSAFLVISKRLSELKVIIHIEKEKQKRKLRIGKMTTYGA